jgi:hypothetical protein
MYENQLIVAKDSIFNDRENLIRIWIEERRSRDASANLMWENVRNLTILIAGLITADIALMDFIESNDRYLLLLPFLPVIIVVLSWYAQKDLEDRWRRVLEAISHLIKLEDLLGLHAQIPDATFFKDDKYLFERWRKSALRYSSSKAFVEGELKGTKEYGGNISKQSKEKKSGNLFTFMPKIYIVTMIVGSVLGGIHIYLLLN